MLTDKREFWNTIRSISADERVSITNTNIRIAKSQKLITKMLQSNILDKNELEDEINCLCSEFSSLSYIQGFQDGTKMLHMLLSGQVLNHIQQIEGEKADLEYNISK